VVVIVWHLALHTHRGFPYLLYPPRVCM
jgi:hypothetical protein